jgi:voltage-gated potassium channel
VNPFKRVLPATFLLLGLATAGVCGYMFLEGWGFLQACYMVIITLFTVGFGEVAPLDPAGRILTMVLIVTGVGTAVYAAGQVLEIILEGELLGFRKRQRMNRMIREMRDHYIICGFGRVGHQIATDFEAAGIRYVVVDSKAETLEELEPRGIPALVGDVTADHILTEAGIQHAKGLVACSDSDVANVYVTLSARALNPALFIVARAGHPETEKKLQIAGANRTVSPYLISGKRMAAMVAKPVAYDFLDMVTHGGELEFQLHEIAIGTSSLLAGKTLADAEIRSRSGATVLAILRAGGKLDLQPQAETRIGGGDILVVLGTQEQMDLLRKVVGHPATP